MRKFAELVEAALFDDNIPPAVYTQLLADVHANLPTLHRYLKLRQRMMGLDKLGYEDLYAPIVQRGRPALHARGGDAADARRGGSRSARTTSRRLRKGLSRPLGRLDADHRQELGRLQHRRLRRASVPAPELHRRSTTRSRRSRTSRATRCTRTSPTTHQPYATARLLDLRRRGRVDAQREPAVPLRCSTRRRTTDTPVPAGSYLDNLRTTLFRQTLFAEFELEIHEMGERGEPLTGENAVEALPRAACASTTVTTQGVVHGRRHVRRRVGVTSRTSIYDFYVYQYATSMIAAIVARGRHRSATAAQKPGTATRNRDAYLAMLSSGSSKYPIDLLKDAGVDMTTSAPFDAAMREMNAIMDEMERIYAKGKH